MRQVGIDVEVHRLIEQNRRSFAESENDILRRILPLLPGPREVAAGRAPAEASPAVRGARRRGQWTVEVEDERIPAYNLVSAYRTLLEALDSRYPHFLGLFAQESGRSRRFLARTAGQLYPVSPHLAERHAAQLASGWYLDTNVSAVQVARRARIAARICGLRYGADVRILDNLRDI